MIFRLILILAPVVSLLALTSCVKLIETPTQWIPASELGQCDTHRPISILNAQTVRYCGEISERLVDEVISELSIPGRNSLVLSSLGGETFAAIKLADFLSHRRIRLQISGLCHSACAQIVLFGASELFVSERTIVGLHYNQNVINQLKGAPASKDMELLAKAERDFYRRYSVPESILFGPITTLQPICIAEFVEEGPRTGIKVLFPKHAYYMPDEVTFRTWYKGNLVSEWPSELEISALLERVAHRQPDSYLRVLYGPLDQINARQFRLPVCPA
jgi:hypothetical protein